MASKIKASSRPHPIRKLLVCNRGEIAIRVFRACTELNIKTVAVYSYEDRFSLHRFKADEAYQVGTPGKPVQAYLNIGAIVSCALQSGADAVHPGYGFLSERYELAEALEKAGIKFVGPSLDTLRIAGNKVATLDLAKRSNVPILPRSPLLTPQSSAKSLAAKVGFPLMVKAAFGGGGRGMRVCRRESELLDLVEAASSEALSAFGRADVYFEKLVQRPKHIEVQLLGDGTGEVVHLFERDCSVQRRHQKVVELAPALTLADETRAQLLDYALSLGLALKLRSAATAEFLVAEDGAVYFIEINPRIQVEHTVTEEVTGVDIVQSQIEIASGATLKSLSLSQNEIRCNGVAIQCRLTTENPQRAFEPDTGKLTTYRSASGFGIRLDAGSAYTGAIISPYYDSLLVKITARARTLEDGARKLVRCLKEFRIRGVSTNIQFLMNVLCHKTFLSGDARTLFIDETPELLKFREPLDRATKILRFLGETTVLGHPAMGKLTRPQQFREPPRHETGHTTSEAGWRDHLLKLGKRKFIDKILNTKELLVTDTTFRDAHQSLIATRLRTRDMLEISGQVAHSLSGLFSLEVWGGATFDVAMRYLYEDPWQRLELLRERIPNILFQMLLRGSNIVGYKNYNSSIIRRFVNEAARAGIDIFRIFDCFNNIEQMLPAIEAVNKTKALAEACICYTGDLLVEEKSPHRRNVPRFDLEYYVRLAKKLERAGADILAIKDMSGLLKPGSAKLLISELKSEIKLPIHLHTHDTAGAGIATYLAASRAGANIVDCAVSSMASVTSQPALESLIAALEHDSRSPQIPLDAVIPYAEYFEAVRSWYAPFESDLKTSTGEVYLNEIPGGQYSNLRPQAEALKLGHKWREIKRAYCAADKLLGRLIKVTPSSKAVGDLAIFMVAEDLTADELLARADSLTLPDSVLELLRGELGRPPGVLPPELVRIAIRSSPPAKKGPKDELESSKKRLNELLHSDTISERAILNHIMFPRVFENFISAQKRYGDLSAVPTKAFLYGLAEGEEMNVDLEPGKRLFITLSSVSEIRARGERALFFELNGQNRTVLISDPQARLVTTQNRKADTSNSNHIAAALSGAVVTIHVKAGEKVKKDAPLVTIEAMKMQTIMRAPTAAKVAQIHCVGSTHVERGDLLMELG